jgi:hypothetical protein
LGVSIWKAVRGDVSCGCFGRVMVHPWYTAGLDAAVIAALCLTCRAFWRQSTSSISGRWFAGAVGILAAAAFVGVWKARPTFATLGATGELPAGDRVVCFDPVDWVGKALPLLSHIDIGDRLSKGRWVLVMHNPQCHRCRDVVPECAELASDWNGRPHVPGIAVVDVLPGGAPGRMTESGHASVVLGHLETKREWFIVTPAILAVENGKVVAVNDDEPLPDWALRVFNLK